MKRQKSDDDIRLQDDFAAAVNKDYFATAVVDHAYGEASLVLDATKLIYEKSMEIVSDDSLTSDNALIFKTWVELHSDWDARNELGVEPVRKYISDIRNISSIVVIGNKSDHLTALDNQRKKQRYYRIGLCFKAGDGIKYHESFFLASPFLSVYMPMSLHRIQCSV